MTPVRTSHFLRTYTFLLFFLTAAVSTSLAQTNTCSGGNWSNNGNWSLGHFPTAAEDAVIAGNTTMNLTTGPFTVNSLTINNNVTLTMGSGSSGAQNITITNNVTLNGNGQVAVSNNNNVHSMTIGGTLSNGAGTFDVYNTATRLCNVTINGTSITGNGSYTFNNLTIGGALTNSSTSNISIRGNLTLNDTFTCSAGTITMNGGLAQSLGGTTNPTFNNFAVATNATNVSLTGISEMTVNGTFTMSNTSTFQFGSGSARTVNIVGNLVTPTTILMQGAGLAHQLRLGGTAIGTPTTFTTTAGSGSIVEYYNATSQNIFPTNAAVQYRNVILSGGGTKTFSGTTTINEDLAITGTNVTVSNGNALTVSGNLYNDTGTTVWGGAGNTLTLAGNLIVRNNSTFTIGSAAGGTKALNIAGFVQVDAGSTLNVGNFAATHTMSITGNLLVDGTINMAQSFPNNVCNVTFAGANTSITSPGGTGSITFNQITVAKTASTNTLDVLTPISMSAPTAAATGSLLVVNTGVFKLSSASTLTPYYNNATICAGTGTVWLNDAGASIACVGTGIATNPGTPTVTGTLRVTAGTFSYGSGNDIMNMNAATSALVIDGGTLNMYGAIALTGTSQFTMTSGIVRVDPQNVLAGGDNLGGGIAVVNLSSTAPGGATFTGGTLTIIDPSGGAGGASLQIGSGTGTYNFAGSTINFGDGSSSSSGAAAFGFGLDAGNRTLSTLNLNNGTSSGTNRNIRLITNDCIISTSLTMGTNASDNLTLNGRTLTLNGILNAGTGTFTGSATSSLVINGNNTPVINLPQIITTNLLNLTINKTGTNATVNLGSDVTLAATGVLTLTAGVLEIGNYNLALNNTAAIGGAPFSASKMIATNGTGYLIRPVAGVGTQPLNPIGAGGLYTPMTLSSITAGGTYSIRVVPTALYPTYINVYWDFLTSVAGKTITATFQYDPSQLNSASQIIAFIPEPYSSVQRPPASGASSFGTNSFTITGNTTPGQGGYWTMGNAVTYYSYQTGDWNSASTWTTDPSGTLQVGATVPGYSDNVEILAGRTVSLSSNITTQLVSLTINSSGFLDMGNLSFTNGLAQLAGEGTLRLSSANFPSVGNNTFVNTGGGTVEYYNTASFNLPATQTTYNNLTINCAGQFATQLINNLTLNGNLLVKSGTFRINDNTANRRQLTIAGNLTVEAGASITVGTGVTNTTTVPTGITTTVAGPFIDYYDAQSHRVVVNGDFTNNGTVRFANVPYPNYDAFPPLAPNATTGFATVYFRGSTNNVVTCNNTTNFYNIVVDKGSDQTYSLTINPSSYSNFKLLGPNTAAADVLMGATATNPNIKKALWIRNGTLILQGSTIIPSLSEGSTAGALPATSDFYIPANGALVLNGPDVVVLGTADDYQEVNTAYAVAGGSGLVNGVAQGGNSALYVYGKLQISDGYLSTRESGGIVTNGGSGQIIISGGNVDAKQLLYGTASTASFQMSNGTFALRGRFRRVPASYATVANLIANSAATVNTARVLNGTTTGFGTFSINNAANIFNMSGGNISIYDVCDAAPPATAAFAFDVKSSTSNYSVTGGTVNMIPMTGTVLADETYHLISSTVPLANLTINRQSSATIVRLNTGYPLTVLSAMNITSGALDANAQNLTVGGHFTIASTGSYTATGASANTTTLNGSGAQTLTVNTAGALDLNNLTLTKTAGVAVTLAGSQNAINVAGAFNLTLGNLNDAGKTVSIAGNVYNSGIHSGAGKITLNGSASAQTIDGAGTFQNLELNNTNAAAAPVSLLANATINGTLTLSQDKLFNISTYNLKFNGSATVANAGTLRYIQSAGNAGDGGITKVYSSPAAFVFPIGAKSTAHAAPAYTPASIGLSAAPTAYGSITVVPVGYAHPNATTAGRSLTYFWRVTSSGFTLGSATVTHGYTYAVADVVTGTNITENGYVAARWDVSGTAWTRGTTSDLDITNKIIGEPSPGTFLQNVGFIDGDYTAGDDTPTNPFGTPRVFYSFASGSWNTATNWTGDPTRLTQTGTGTPGATDIVKIGAGHTISFGTPANYLTNPNTDPHSCATLYIEANSVLDVRYNPASNLGIVMNSPGGNGKIRITTSFNSPATFANPSGDFSAFNTNLGTTELYSTNNAAGTVYYMANGVTTYGNLLFSPLGGSNILFPNNDVLIYGNCTETGGNADSWLLPAWNTNYPTAPTVPVAKTITINGNLDIQGGAFGWYGTTTAQNVVVKGNITVCTTCAMGVFGGGASPQTLRIGGTLTNNGNGTTNGMTGVDLQNVPTTFDGNTSASITSTAGTPQTRFGTVIVNKGSSQATTLNLNIGGTLITPTDNWLTLQNGTLQYQRTNPATNFTISTVTNLNIPSTAGLYVNYANASNTNVLIANNGSDASDLMLSGKLTVASGNVYIGQTGGTTAFNNDIEYTGTSAAIQVTGGNLYVNGQIRRSTASTNGALTYTQSGGAVTIYGNSTAGGLTTALTRAKLEVLNTGSQFNMSAGTLTIAKGGGTSFGDLYIRPASSSVTGGTIIFDNTVPNAVQTYTVDTNVNLYNLTVSAGGAGLTNATVSLMTNPLVLNGSLTLSNARSFFNTNNLNVTINQNLVNNAATANYIYGTSLTTFDGATQNISGTTSTNFYDLDVSSSLSLTVNSSFSVTRNLTISSGSLLLNTAKVSVLTNGNFMNNGAYSDDNVSGGVAMAGTATQQVSGTGSFNRLEINNTVGVSLLNDITLDHNLVMTNGIFDIQSNNLTLNTGSNLTGAPFSTNKMLKTDGTATSPGLTKFFPVIASPTTFTFPMGVGTKYTPAVYTINANGSIGYIRVGPVNAYQPTVSDPTRVLDYYWSISSSGISGFDGSLALNYLSADVNGSEPDYVAAWLQLPGTYWSKAAVGAATDNVNEATNQITFPFPAGSSNLNGDFTAGEDSAIPNEIPTYISNADGNWSDNTIWTPVGTSPPCPPGGPNGYNVIIAHNVSTTVNNCFAYTTVIEGTGTLSILSPTYGHNFGTVDGDPSLGTGKLYLQGPNMPAGNFTSFMDCSGGGTVEYGGTGTYTLVLNGVTSFPNLTFSGTGTRVLPNDNLTICNVLSIDGPTLDNSVNNIGLTIEGSMQRYNTGAFLSGSGSTATVTFAGSAAQSVGGPTGDFSGGNAFNNLEINNGSGLSIGANGTIEVTGNLRLTNGIITTTALNKLSILNTSPSAVVPTGGSATSFVNGPLNKEIINGNSFVYPLGSGTIKGHTFTLTSSSTGSSLFTAQYFTPNPTAASVTPPIVKLNRMEYWGVSATTTKTAKVQIAWDSQSDLNALMTTNGISDMVVAQYNTGTSSWEAQTSTASGTLVTGDAITTNSVTLSTTPLNYTLGSLTDARPIAVMSPGGAVCGTAGIPITFTTHVPITLSYTISYKFNGVDQTPIVVNALPFTLPTPAAGTYELTGFTYNGSSVAGAVDPTIITSSASPTTANAGLNQSVCNATSLNLSGNNPTVGTGLWTIVSGTGGWFNVPNATNYNALFGGPPGHTYTLRWTITNGACTSSDDVVISFPYAPLQPSGFTAAPTSVCKGSGGYVYTVPSVATATSYVWSYSGTGATITGTTNSPTVAYSATATSGNISVSAVNGCGTGTARSIAVTVVTPAVATFSYTATPYCINAGADPNPTFSGGGVAGTFSSAPAGLVFVSTATGQVNLAASTPGTYTVTNTIAASAPCGVITSNSTITITGIGSWLGGTSGNWLDPNNWICTTVPTSTTDVVIPNSAPNMPVITGAAVCRNLTINNGASLTINGTNNLDIYGNWSNNGTFTRNSSTVTFNAASTIGGSATTTFNNITIAAAGNVTVSSGTSVAGDWTNNGTFTPSGTVSFTGTTPSLINGSTTFNNLTMAKTGANATLNGAGTTTVNNVLTLTTGHIVSSTGHILSMPNSGTVAGSSANSFVSGPMQKVVSAGSFTFPLGSVSANRFRPATVSGVSGADTWTGEYFGTDPSNGGLNHNFYNGTFVKKVSMFEYWVVSRLGGTSANLALAYGSGSYLGSDIGAMSTLKLVHWNGTTWDSPPGATGYTATGSVTAGTVRADGITSFSPFTFGSDDQDSPLPVELLYFKATLVNHQVQLKWETASEKNNDYFTVEKATNPESFEALVRVDGQGTTNSRTKYSSIDTHPFVGTSYYRLKQTDFDGGVSYSGLQAIQYDGATSSDFALLQVYPNPSNGKTFTVEVLGLNNETEIPLEIVNSQGQLVYSRTYEVKTKGTFKEEITLSSPLRAGIYLIKAGPTLPMIKKLMVE